MDKELKQRARSATQRAVVDAAQKYHPVRPRGIDWKQHEPHNSVLGHREQIRRLAQLANLREKHNAGKRDLERAKVKGPMASTGWQGHVLCPQAPR